MYPPLQIKELELTNPTGKLVSYTVRLEGHKDFTVETRVVKIEPRGTAKLMVRCHPLTSTPKTARLILVSSKDGGVNAATLVFNLLARFCFLKPLPLLLAFPLVLAPSPLSRLVRGAAPPTPRAADPSIPPPGSFPPTPAPQNPAVQGQHPHPGARAQGVCRTVRPPYV